MSNFLEDNRPFFFDEENGQVTVSEGISSEDKIKIGKIAKQKKSEWYKRIDLGEKLGYIVWGDRSKMDAECNLWKTLTELEQWISKDETRRS